MADFSSMSLKIERAKLYVDQLETLIGAFQHKANMHRIVREDHPETGKSRMVYRGQAPMIDPAIPLTIGDAAHNLRSALDHFAFAVVPPGSMAEHRIQFPIWRMQGVTPNATQWKDQVRSSIQNVTPELHSALLALQPYEGGNAEFLWTVDRIDVLDKHRALLASSFAHTVCIDAARGMSAFLARAFPDVDWSDAIEISAPIMLAPTNRQPLEDGQILLETDLDADNHAEFAFFIALDEPPAMQWIDVAPALRALIDEVEGFLQRLVALA